MKYSKNIFTLLLASAVLIPALASANESSEKKPEIFGYTMGAHQLKRSPVSLKDLESLKKALLLGQ
jgi:hypothetical protein